MEKMSLKMTDPNHKNEEQQKSRVLLGGQCMCEGVGARQLASVFGTQRLRLSKRLSRLATALCRQRNIGRGMVVGVISRGR